MIHIDNRSAIALTKNHVFHEHTKHIEKNCHFIREKIEAGDLKTLHVRTENHLADPFNKALYTALFHRLMSNMGLQKILTPC